MIRLPQYGHSTSGQDKSCELACEEEEEAMDARSGWEEDGGNLDGSGLSVDTGPGCQLNDCPPCRVASPS
jgi:hypothetical protein